MIVLPNITIPTSKYYRGKICNRKIIENSYNNIKYMPRIIQIDLYLIILQNQFKRRNFFF